jgi:hypothetical protein
MQQLSWSDQPLPTLRNGVCHGVNRPGAMCGECHEIYHWMYRNGVCHGMNRRGMCVMTRDGRDRGAPLLRQAAVVSGAGHTVERSTAVRGSPGWP